MTKTYRCKFERLKSCSIVLAAYTILSLIFTYPVAFTSNKIPGYGDAFWFLWDFWWFKTALLDFTSPYYTNYIFHPTGVSLASSTITPLNAIASIPLQMAFGLVEAYKIIWILSFILSGFGVFLLVRYLVGDSRAAFVSGLIFMFCPYHFAHALGHMNLISTQWIPLYVLFLIKTVNEKNKSSAFLAAFFLLLNAISCYYYLIYLLVFSMIYLLYIWRCSNNIFNFEMIQRVGILAISFMIIFMPFMYPVVKELVNSEYFYYGGFVEYSADFLGFFVPSIFHPHFKEFVAPIYSNFTGNSAEHTVFLGYIVILLSILAIIKVKQQNIKFWWISSIVFFVLSLGPILHINGIVKICLDGYTTYIPLPYAILMHIPVFSLARVPSRWTVLLMLSVAILAGFGIKYLLDRYDNPRPNRNKVKINVLIIIVSSVVLFEFLAIPYPMESSRIPPFYELLAANDEDFAVMEVPLLGYSEVMYYQTLHEKKLVGGYVSRFPKESINFLKLTPLIRDLLNFYTSDNDIINQEVTETAVSILNYYNIKYIILHTDRLNAEQLEFSNDLIKRSIKEEPQIYERDSMIVYEIKKEPISSFMVLSGGWHDLEDWSGIPTRWMDDDASLLIYSGRNRTAELRLQVVSFYRPRTMEIYLNDRSLMWAEIPSQGFVVVNVPMDFIEGANLIRLYMPKGCERPYDIKELNNKDRRCLSVAVQNVTITYTDEDLVVHS